MVQSDFIDKTFTLATGVTFKVLGIDLYPPDKVSKKYKEILDFGPNQVAAVKYRTTLIPNITAVGGVARLTKIEVNGQTFSKPKAISAALNILEPMEPIPLVL